MLHVNPFLLHVNSKDRHANDEKAPEIHEVDQQELAKLWSKSKKLSPKLSKDKFVEGIKAYLAQHHCLPPTVEKVKIPGINAKQNPVMIDVGRVPNVVYEVPKYSRKAPHSYIHETENERLVTSPDGKVKMFHGKMRMCPDGWLRK